MDFLRSLGDSVKKLVPGQQSQDSLMDATAPTAPPAAPGYAGKRRKSKKTKKGGRKSRRKTARRI